MKETLWLIPDEDRKEPLSLSVPKTLADRIRGQRPDGSSASAWAVQLFYEAYLPELLAWTMDDVSIRRYIDATLDLGSGSAAGFNLSLSKAIDEADMIARRLQERIAAIESGKTALKKRLDDYRGEAARRFERAAAAADRFDSGELPEDEARALVTEALGHGARITDDGQIKPRSDDFERLREYLHWVRSLPMVPGPNSDSTGQRNRVKK